MCEVVVGVDFYILVGGFVGFEYLNYFQCYVFGGYVGVQVVGQCDFYVFGYLQLGFVVCGGEGDVSGVYV